MYRFSRAFIVMTALLAIVVQAGCKPPFSVGTTGEIAGIIRDSSDNAPVEGVIVSTSPATQTVATGADGHYRIDEVKPGAYLVSVSRPDYFDGSQSVTVAVDEVSGADFLLVADAGPTTGSISGAVVNASNNAPIQGAAVTTTPASATVTSSASGAFVIANLAPGSYQVQVSMAGYQVGTASAVVVAGSQTPVQIGLTAVGPVYGNISGSVVSSTTGLPVPNAAITTVPATATIYSDASGHFMLANVAPGAYQVVASCSGYQSAGAVATVVANQQVQVSLSLVPAFTESESNDLAMSANLVNPIATITGHIGPDGVDSFDYYRIIIPEGNHGVLQLDVRNTNSSGQGWVGKVAILDATETVLVHNGGATSENNTERLGPIPVTAGATYYLSVAHYGATAAASYQLTPLFTPGTTVDPYPADDSAGTATILNMNGEATSMIGYGSPVDMADWYRIDVATTGTLRVVITNLHPSIVNGGWIGATTLYNSSLVAVKTNGGATSENVTETLGGSSIAVTAGSTYYVKVAQSGNDAAPYRLSVLP